MRAAGRDVSESASPVPARASVLFDRPVAAAERRVHTKQDYIESFEDRIGRKLTQAEVKTVDLGCIGLTMVRLGRTGIEVPPTNLAFADARAHRLVAETEKVLGPGEIANDAVNRLRRDLTRARQDLETELKKPGAGQDSFTVPRLQAKIKELEDEYEQAKTTTRQYWVRIGAEQVTALLEARDAAKAVGGQQVFQQVSEYAAKFNDILATGPADAAKFAELVRADKHLAPLRGVTDALPSGDLSNVRAHIFAKHFWSGQEEKLGLDGKPATTILGHPLGTSSVLPNPDRFAPHPHTGQVDMSKDLFQGKPGFIKFDYGWYDEGSGSWWHANHAERTDPEDPMRVYQSGPERFFTGYPDFDSSVVCIAFVRDMP
ncbi:hypothetical protein K8O92_27095 [Nocardia asteroides]|nr:hypothetical protein K8O92_27095 [Nocardia asteroides]